jgi:perosamine synthetase
MFDVPNDPMIPYGRQTIDEDDIAAVVRTLRSDFLTCGPEVEAFEREFGEFVGATHAVAVANATDALHLAMRVAGIGPGDRVVTSPNTFLASANCAAFVGAIPDFCDIDPVSYNLDPVALEAGWKPDTKAVVAVAYAGQAANMPEIARIARSRGAVVIEDACHGTGGGFRHDGRDWKLGGHPWADITTFSFHPVKTMTTGEGGMLVTDNPEYARRARMLRGHGIERDSSRFQGFGSDNPAFTERGPWVYEMQELGYNHRITDIQCALGRSQLKKLTQFIERRLEIVARYNEAFTDIPWLTTPQLAPWLIEQGDASRETRARDKLEQGDASAETRASEELVPISEQSKLSSLASPCSMLHAPPSLLASRVSALHAPPHRISWHLYTVQIDFSTIGLSRTEVMLRLREKGIGTQVLYIPVHLQPWYRNTYGYLPGKCPAAEDYYSRALSLPLYPAMTNEEVERVISAVRELATP